MTRERFDKVAEEVLDSLPQEFRRRIRNVAVLVEDSPPHQQSPQPSPRKQLLLGIFHGVPTTKKSVFDIPAGPITSCSIRRTLRRSAPVMLKSAGKSALRSFTN
jgi:predicted Zn-dependent protease with MMP-like domain